MRRKSILLVVLGVTLLSGAETRAQAVPPLMSASISDGVPGVLEEGVMSWTLDVAAPLTEFVEVEIDIVITSRHEPCLSDPTNCGGIESQCFFDGNRAVYGCTDGTDNDDDGLADSEDPDCLGAAGWSYSISTADEFNIQSITEEGTAASLVITPPGRRAFQSFHKMDVVDPEKNEGQQGTVGATILGYEAVYLTLEDVVAKVRGRISTEGLKNPGDRTAPLLIRIHDPTEVGLRGAGEPVKTGITMCLDPRANCESVVPEIRSASVQLVLSDPSETSVQFRRSDANDDGEVTIADISFIVSFLFLGGTRPHCLDAVDTDDSGDFDTTDAIGISNYLFLGTSTPSAPGPLECGLDPTEDEFDCDSSAC